MRVIFSLIFCISSFNVGGQVLLDITKFNLDSVITETTSQLPKDLTSGKAAIIHVGESQGWKKRAQIAQQGLKQAAIDGVAHYNLESFYSGKESQQAFLKQLEEREIDFLIYFREKPNPEIYIFPFKGELSAPKAFHMMRPATKDLFHDLYLLTHRTESDITNYLILGVPAYMDYPEIIGGRRAEFYDLNMKSGKLAIPVDADSTFINQFDSLMNAYYPFEYGFVEPDLSTADLRKQGFWFIMYGVQGTGKLVRNLLEYETDKDETAYATIVARDNKPEVKRLPVDAEVVKFYIKDVRNDDVFLGKHYDADRTWQQALINYIENLAFILDR